MDSWSEDSRDMRLLTVDEVFRMVDAGVLREEDHVELLEGVLYTMSPQGPEHASLTVRVHRWLERAFGEGCHLRDHSNLRLDDRSLPEPDVVVVRGSEDDYFTRLPTGVDVRLVVEIAKTSQRRDRKKARLYARAGVEEYWILDLVARSLWVHKVPSGDLYADIRVLSEDDDVTVQDTGVVWPVRDLLP